MTDTWIPVWTSVHAERLRAYLDRPGYEIPAGLGDKEAACSLAAIRLAWDGQLSDSPPPCMSPVLAEWIIAVQDAMPSKMRNSPEWRTLLPLAAGTGNDHERERDKIILDWMFDTVNPVGQPMADTYGYGAQWRSMRWQPEYTAKVARAVAKARRLDDEFANALARAATAADSAVGSDGYSDSVKSVTSAIALSRANGDAWTIFDPIGLLRRLIAVSSEGDTS